MKQFRQYLISALLVLMAFALLVGCKPADSTDSSNLSNKGITSGTQGKTSEESIDSEGSDISDATSEESKNAVSGNQSKSSSSVQSGQVGSRITSGGGVSQAFIAALRGTKINITTAMTEKPQRGTSSGDRYYSVLSKIGQKYGATIQTVNVAHQDLLTSIMTGSPSANVLSVENYNLGSYLSAGAAASLDTAMKEADVTFKEDWYNQEIRKLMNIGSKQYGWISDIVAPYFIFYNKKMVGDAKLTDPYELYSKGTWDFNTLKTYLNALTKRNPDGSYITYGLGAASMVMGVKMFTYQNGGDVISFKNNTLSYALQGNNSLGAINFVFDLMRSGQMTTGGDTWNAQFVNFSQGKTAMLLSTKYVVSLINDNKMKDPVGIVPVPFGPDSKGNKNIYYEQAFTTLIPKPNEKDAGKILFLMNEIYKELYANREKDFKDDFGLIIRDTAAFNLFKDSSLKDNKAFLKYDGLAGVNDQMTSLVNAMYTGGSNPAQAVDSYADIFGTAIKDKWGNLKFTGK